MASNYHSALRKYQNLMIIVGFKIVPIEKIDLPNGKNEGPYSMIAIVEQPY